MKEVIGKRNKSRSRLPTRLVIDKNDVTSEIGIANEFNKFFTNIGPELAEKIPTASRTFESFLSKIDATMSADPVTITELKEAFFSLKTSKSPGYDEVSSNCIKNCFSDLNYPLKYLLGKSIEKGDFPNALKIARVTPLFKGGDPSDISNYRPISVLPCFSKILERIMSNCLYKYLTTDKLLYSKQFGFQTARSAEHAIVKLVDQIYKSFEKDRYTLGVFIDLSKAFDTVDHTILIRKFEMCGIKGIPLACFHSYLTHRLQYISIAHDFETDPRNVCCGVPQGSILGPLLFLLYVNDLHNSSALDPIMFADDTNLFYEHKDLKTLFPQVNQELLKINERFEANRLSVHVGKTKCSLFHKPSRKDDLPLLLPRLLIKKHKVERVKSIKFLEKIILSVLKIKSPKTLVYYIGQTIFR